MLQTSNLQRRNLIATTQPHLPYALYLLDIATKGSKTRLGPLDNMPTHSEKKRTEFALASTAENIALATALGSGDEGDESSGMSLVENLTLAGGYLSSIRYFNPRPPNSSAGRHGDALDIIYNYTDAAFRSEFRVNRDVFWKLVQLLEERCMESGANTVEYAGWSNLHFFRFN